MIQYSVISVLLVIIWTVVSDTQHLLNIYYVLGTILGESNGNPLQYCCLENPMDRGAWKAAVHWVVKSRTWLSDFTFTFHFHTLEKEMATYSSVLAWRIPGTGAWWAAVYGVAQSRTSGLSVLFHWSIFLSLCQYHTGYVITYQLSAARLTADIWLLTTTFR